MNRTTEMAGRIEELMAGGLSLTDALSQAQQEFQPKKAGARPVIADRVSWIQELGRIDELRKAIKVAFAKKSKAKGKPETEEKYQREINAGRERLNELLAEVNAADRPYYKALELGEDVSGVLQLFIESKEVGLEERVKDITSGMTAAARKELISSQPVSTPWSIRTELLELGDEFLTQYEARAGRGDQRILTLNKRLGFLDSQVQAEDGTELGESEPTNEENTQDDTQEESRPRRGRSRRNQAEDVEAAE